MGEWIVRLKLDYRTRVVWAYLYKRGFNFIRRNI
jgi:hypothetical protein